MNIAIIGAGFSACFLYKNLAQHDVNITLFEKSRGTGGRLATKYVDDKFIDHGTSSIKTKNIKNKEFLSFLQTNAENGILRKQDDEYFPLKGINKLCSSMLTNIEKNKFFKQTKIVEAKFLDNKWHLKDENNNEYNDFDKLFITIPSYQILQMDLDLDSKTRKSLEKVKYDSMATLICYKDAKIDIDEHKLEESNFFKKIINNSSKYNYEDFSSFVFHLNTDFSNKFNNLSKDELFELISMKIKDISNFEIDKQFNAIQHLWKYAFVREDLKQDYIYQDNNLGICGDYFNGKNLEASFNSSKKLYEKISLELI